MNEIKKATTRKVHYFAHPVDYLLVYDQNITRSLRIVLGDREYISLCIYSIILLQNILNNENKVIFNEQKLTKWKLSGDFITKISYKS